MNDQLKTNYFGSKMKRWDEYFLEICNAVCKKSPCMSRKIGAVLVKDKSIVSTGYNGPPRGIPHCGTSRIKTDQVLGEALGEYNGPADKCPRRILDFKSGEGIEWCTAQHAEENAVSNAARLGTSVLNTTLYMNSVIPCQKCLGTLINAGVAEIVVLEDTEYDRFSHFTLYTSGIKVRRFTNE